MKNENLITIRKYSSAYEANIDKSFLNSHGIRSFLKNEAIQATDPLFICINPIELQVLESHVKKANQLLNNSK